jgi:hypothetical protein
LNHTPFRLYPILSIPLYATLTVDSEMKWIADEGCHGS